MKRFAFLFLWVAAAWGVLHARTWTATDGRSLEADIVRKTEDSVTIRMANGRVYTIPLERLIEKDRQFVANWEPVELDVPKLEDAIVKIEQDNSTGSGFVMQKNGVAYVYTNQHVISGMEPSKISIETANGEKLRPVGLEVADRDLARLKVDLASALRPDFDPALEDEIRALGNSGGAGVLTSSDGKIVGLSGDEIEVTAEIIPGNSGGPIVTADDEVVGIATYIKKELGEGDWTTENTRYEKVRRFALRLRVDEAWHPVNPHRYFENGKALEEVTTNFGEWISLISSMASQPLHPVNRQSENYAIRQLIEEHNREAARFRSRVRNGLDSTEFYRERQRFFVRMEAQAKRMRNSIDVFKFPYDHSASGFQKKQIIEIQEVLDDLMKYFRQEAGS